MTQAKQTKKKTPRKGAALHKHVKHLLLPHKGNEYRPYLTRRYGLLCIVLVGLLVQVAYNVVTQGQFAVLGRESNITVSELVEYTNNERAKEGAPALVLNESLTEAASLKAQDMVTNGYWAHTSPSGVTPWKWLADAAYSYDVAGENLAKNFPNAQATVEAWMASPTHKANILDTRYQDVGFAVVDGVIDGRITTVVVAYYGRSASAVAAANTPILVNAAAVGGNAQNPLVYFGSAIQSLSPATIGALALLALAGVVALLAHHYRHQLPKAWRRSWKLHHGLYKFGGLLFIAVMTIFTVGGGQI